MLKTYRSHRSAKSAARKTLGAEAVENVDYKLVPVEDTSAAARASALPDALWTWEVIAAPAIDPTEDDAVIHQCIGAAAVDNVGITGAMDMNGIIASATGALIARIGWARKIDVDYDANHAAYRAVKLEAGEAIERVLSASRAHWAAVKARPRVSRSVIATETRGA
jgi:hypothetical protein